MDTTNSHIGSIDESAWTAQFNSKIRTKPPEQESFSMLLCDINKCDDVQKEFLFKILFINHSSPEFWAQYIEYVYRKNSDKKLHVQKLVFKALELLDEQENKDNKPYVMINLLCAELKSKPIDSLKYLQMMWKHGIGKRIAVYYLQWAEKESNLNGAQAAVEVINKGLGCNAEPRPLLISKLVHFESLEEPNSVSVRKPRTPYPMTPKSTSSPMASLASMSFTPSLPSNSNLGNNTITRGEHTGNHGIIQSGFIREGVSDESNSNQATGLETDSNLPVSGAAIPKTPSNNAVRNLFMNNAEKEHAAISLIEATRDRSAGNENTYSSSNISTNNNINDFSSSNSVSDINQFSSKTTKPQSILRGIGLKHNGKVLASLGKAERVKVVGDEEMDEDTVVDQLFRAESNSVTHHTPYARKAPLNIASTIANSVPRQLGQNAGTASPRFQRYIPKFKSEDLAESTDEESDKFDPNQIKGGNDDFTSNSLTAPPINGGSRIGGGGAVLNESKGLAGVANSLSNENIENTSQSVKRGLHDDSLIYHNNNNKRRKESLEVLKEEVETENETKSENLPVQQNVESIKPFKATIFSTNHVAHINSDIPNVNESESASAFSAKKPLNNMPKKHRSVSFVNAVGSNNNDMAIDSGSVLAAGVSKANPKANLGLIENKSAGGTGSKPIESISSFKFPLAYEILTLNKSNYMVLGILGKGGSSIVYRVLSESGQILAFKRVEVKGKGGSDEDVDGLIESYSNEINLLLKLKGSKYIIELYDYEIEKDRISMVMEAGDVDLAKVISTKRRQNAPVGVQGGNGNMSAVPACEHSLNTFFIRLIWQEMLEAVNFIHENRIVHGDLKPANFVFVKGHLKLIDFGIAKAISSDTTNIYRDSHVGTINYMAPEAISPTEDLSSHGDGADDSSGSGGSGSKTMKLGRASDIWSLGCILYQMVYGKPPFASLNMIQKLSAIPNEKYPIAFGNTRSTSFESDPNDKGSSDRMEEFEFNDHLVIETMKGCLQRNPKYRSTIKGKDGLLRQPFLNMAYYYGNNKLNKNGSSLTSKTDDSSSIANTTNKKPLSENNSVVSALNRGHMSNVEMSTYKSKPQPLQQHQQYASVSTPGMKHQESTSLNQSQLPTVHSVLKSSVKQPSYSQKSVPFTPSVPESNHHQLQHHSVKFVLNSPENVNKLSIIGTGNENSMDSNMRWANLRRQLGGDSGALVEPYRL